MIISGYKFYCTKNANENLDDRKGKNNAMAQVCCAINTVYCIYTVIL